MTVIAECLVLTGTSIVSLPKCKEHHRKGAEGTKGWEEHRETLSGHDMAVVPMNSYQQWLPAGGCMKIELSTFCHGWVKGSSGFTLSLRNYKQLIVSGGGEVIFLRGVVTNKLQLLK